MNKKKKEYSKFALRLLVMAVATGGMFFLIGMLKGNRTDEVFQNNVKRVRQLADVRVEEVEAQIKALDQEETVEEPVVVSSGTVRSVVDIKRAFRDCVMIGDSIAEGTLDYRILDSDMVVYERGISIPQSTSLLDRAAGLNPKAVFLVFGLNDLQWFPGDPGSFADAYRKQILYLRSMLPNAAIYINSVFPAKSDVAAKDPLLAYYPQFNESLKAVCQELNVIFVDTTFLLEGKDELYSGDGQHPIKSFYPVWLSYLEDVAGL